VTGSNIAFIPFRSGSTRLPNKNILPLAGLPLAAWTLLAANKCERIDKIILSTDDEDAFNLIRNSAQAIENVEKEILFDHRAIEDAGSKVKIFDYIKHGLQGSLVDDADTVIQMLPTSPFRRVSSVEEALRLYIETGVGRFAAAEYDFRVSFAFSITDESFTPLFEECPMITGNTQSQSHPPMYHPCGVFNIFNMGEARKSMVTIYDTCKPFLVNREESFDIDTPDDFSFMTSIADIFKTRLLAS
jgi:CMP-N-acetylneuraminic acid synthetase